jgi:hypothetical protein
MDFPADWVVHPMEDFAISAPNFQGDLTLELLDWRSSEALAGSSTISDSP